MKKCVFVLLLPCFVFLILSLGVSSAQAELSPLPALVSDADPAGTNVRSAPSGEVVAVVPFVAGPRVVQVLESQKGWFRVAPFPLSEYEIEGASTVPAEGWMHGSVLALCACASEDGDPWLYVSPSWRAKSDIRIPADSPLRPLERRGEWLKVRTTQNGKKIERWMHEQQAEASVGDLLECQSRLAEGWKK